MTGRLQRVTKVGRGPRSGAGAVLLGLCVLVTGLALPGQVTAAAPMAAPPAVVPSAAVPSGRLIVGDSLAVSVTSRMRAQRFRVHAQVGRQFSTAPGIVRSFGTRLPRNVVVELGMNGTISLSHCRSVVRTAGRDRRVFLVTNRVPRSWERVNLRTVRTCNRGFAGPRVRVINWYRHSAGHPEWFAGDRVHLSSSGQRAFARLIDRSVDRSGLR